MRTSHAFSRYKPTVFKKRRGKKRSFRILKICILVYFLKFLLTFLFLQPLQLSSQSMAPTLHTGDRLVLIPLRYGPNLAHRWRLPGIRDLQRGDLVVIRHPSFADLSFVQRSISTTLSFLSFGLIVPYDAPYFIRRVIALPGDIVKIEDYVAYILHEGSYVREDFFSNTPRIVLQQFSELHDAPFLRRMERKKIGQDEIFVLADNRREGLDSRHLERIPLLSIQGIVAFRYFPFSRIQQLY